MAKISKSVSTSVSSNNNTGNNGNKRRELVQIGCLNFDYIRDAEGNIMGAEGAFGNLESANPSLFDDILFFNGPRTKAKIFASSGIVAKVEKELETKGIDVCCYIVRDDKKWLKGKICGNRWQTQSQDFSTGEVRNNEIVFFQTNFWSDNPNKDIEHQQLRPGDVLMFAALI